MLAVGTLSSLNICSNITKLLFAATGARYFAAPAMLDARTMFKHQHRM